MRTALLVTVLLLAPPAMGCGCSAPESISDVDSGSIIFKGRVKSVLGVRGILSDTKTYYVTFEVLDAIRGVDAPTLTVSFAEKGATSCDLMPVPLEVGSDWLLSADGEDDTSYSNNYCDLRQRI